MVWDVLSWVSTLGGLFFIVVGSIGVLRLPDVYTRLQTRRDERQAVKLAKGLYYHRFYAQRDGDLKLIVGLSWADEHYLIGWESRLTSEY